MNYERKERKTHLFGVRLYADQLESLQWIIAHKRHYRLKIADLVREAVDQFIDSEKK